MDKIVIRGGRKLNGTVEISGSKNATLPLLAATLLAEGDFTIKNVPVLRDVNTMTHLLRIIGAKISFEDHIIKVDTRGLSFFEAPYELVKTMRASIYVLGPLLGRFGQVRVSLPGGCAWGPRPVDMHIQAMKKLGASIELEGGYIIAKCKRLTGNRIDFQKSSVGATGNALLAAVLAKGETVITKAAREPEISSLAGFLVKMGAQIEGIGTDTLYIQGKDSLEPCIDEVISDRIEAATYLTAAALTGGKVKLKNVMTDHLKAVLEKFSESGFSIETDKNSISITADKRPSSVDIQTDIYPGFPTDMQAQWIVLMSIAAGKSFIEDTIYHDRFTHVAELRRLGAEITMKSNIAIVEGIDSLKGAPVMSTDLRASASLILGGLVASGTTEVLRVYHIDRGYEKIDEKLRKLGADIHRESGSF